MKVFTITRAFTHNIVLSHLDGVDYILIGKGIGFNVKTKETIAENQITSFYRIQDVEKMSRYERMVMDTDDRVLLLTEEAILLAENRLDYKFDESIHLSLLDHINFAVYRFNNRLEVNHFMSDEYYLMYSDLYDHALAMVKIINEGLGIELPHSEVGSIILHLHAALRKETISTSALYAMIVDHTLLYLKEHEGESILNNSIAKARLITHLKFALKRTSEGVTLENPLIEMFKEAYHDYFILAQSLADSLLEKFDVVLPEAEVGYIALHIYNLKHS